MNKTSKAVITSLQAMTVVGSVSPSLVSADHAASKNTDGQVAINKASLKAIEQSWLMVPRMCKAAGFNAQPVPLQKEVRTEAVQLLYSSFGV